MLTAPLPDCVLTAPLPECVPLTRIGPLVSQAKPRDREPAKDEVGKRYAPFRYEPHELHRHCLGEAVECATFVIVNSLRGAPNVHGGRVICGHDEVTFRKSYLTIVNALGDAFKDPPGPAGVKVMRAREIAKHAIWDIGLRVLSELQLSSGVAATPPPLAPPVLILDNDGRHEVKHLDLSRPVCIGLPQFGNEIVLDAERRFHDQQANEHARAKTSRVHLIIFPLGVKLALVDSRKARGITIRDRDPPVPDGSSSSNARIVRLARFDEFIPVDFNNGTHMVLI